MAEKNYLWLRFFARTFDAFLYIFLFLLLSFFLRKINSYIFTPYLFSPYHSFLSLSIIFIILSICEFYIFYVFEYIILSNSKFDFMIYY